MAKGKERESFCIKTKGLDPNERKQLSTELKEFIAEKKAEFSETRQNKEGSK